MKPDAYPLPRTEDCVDQVGAAKFVTKLDLFKGILADSFNSKGQRDLFLYHPLRSIFLYCYAVWSLKCTSHISSVDEYRGSWGTRMSSVLG